MTTPVHEPRVRVELVGAPDWVPRFVTVGQSKLIGGRLKIPFKAGAHRFLFDCHVKRESGNSALFVTWGHTQAAC